MQSLTGEVNPKERAMLSNETSGSPIRSKGDKLLFRECACSEAWARCALFKTLHQIRRQGNTINSNLGNAPAVGQAGNGDARARDLGSSAGGVDAF